jgi:hypothetical protein
MTAVDVESANMLRILVGGSDQDCTSHKKAMMQPRSVRLTATWRCALVSRRH